MKGGGMDVKQVIASRGYSTTKKEVKELISLERVRSSLDYYEDLYNSEVVSRVRALSRRFNAEVSITNCLYDQTIRALSSISSNILEGFSRSTSVDNLRFLKYSLGSAYETKNHLNINPDVPEGFFDEDIDNIIRLTKYHVEEELLACSIYEEEVEARAVSAQLIKLGLV